MKESRAPYGFLAPYLGIFGLFWLGPILDSLWISMTNTRAYPWRFEPAVNWLRLPRDPFFWKALGNTLGILALQVPFMLALALLMALALNTRVRGLAFFRFAFFAPIVVGAVPYSAVFRLLFNTHFGLVNACLGGLGLPGPDWLYQATPAMAVLVIALTWRWTGYNAVLILSGLRAIPEDLYEAAEVDGANPWQRLTLITLPALRPVLLFTAILSVIGTLQLFVEPLLITSGGPANATLTLGVYLYRQGFYSFNFGYAASLAYTVALLAGLFSLLQLRLGEER